VSAGQFKESAKAERVFFIEELDIDKGEVKNIFVADSKNGKLSVAVSSTGFIQNSEGGEKSIVLRNGRRYEGQPTQPDFRILEFEEYNTKIRSKETLAPAPRDREKTVHELINEPNPAFVNPSRAELLWRIGLRLMAL